MDNSQQEIAKKNNIIQNEINSYQKFTINYSGIIELYESTKNKYDIIKIALDLLGDNFTFIDLGCCFGMFGLKIAQNYNAYGDLINITSVEIEKGTFIKNLLEIKNVNFINTNIMTIVKQYDLVICMSVIHHLLNGNNIDVIMLHLQKMTLKYAVLEFPLYGDVLLDNWLNSSPNKSNYDCAKTMETMFEVIGNYFTILTTGYLEYQTGKLNRVYCVVKKIE